MPGAGRLIQRDFSAGMFRSIAPELIPAGGLWDVTNGLLTEDGAIQRRGGSRFRSAALDGPITMLWDGLLASGGQTTLAVTASGMSEVGADGALAAVAGAPGLVAPGRPAALDGKVYLPGGKVYDGATVTDAPVIAPYYAVVANRLLAAHDDQVQFSGIVAAAGAAPVFDPTDLHLIPGGARILGLEGLRDAAMVFTTEGVFLIGGLALNLTDDVGNVQQRLDHYSQELVLWGDAGIAAWEGGLVIPGTDAVWIVSLGVTSEAPQQFQRISAPIETLYRYYVAAGYRPGQATVFEGHYVLPIVDAGAQVIDTLVCRLDMPARPWTHLAGFSTSCMALTRRVTSARRAELLGGHVAGRVLEQAWFAPTRGVERDADDSTFSWSVTTRAASTGDFDRNTITKLRVSYELADPLGVDPTIEASLVPRLPERVGTMWGQFKWGEASWSGAATESVELVPLTGGAPEDEYGLRPFTWPVAKKVRFAMFRLSCDDATSRLSLRALETFVRASSRV